MSTESDEILQILRQGIEGDQEAISQLWNRYRDRLRRVVRLRLDRRLQSRLDPSDVLQEAFIDFAGRAWEYADNPEVSFAREPRAPRYPSPSLGDGSRNRVAPRPESPVAERPACMTAFVDGSLRDPKLRSRSDRPA